MKVCDLRVGTVLYHVGATDFRALFVDDAGQRHHARLDSVSSLLPKMDALREELRTSRSVALGQVRRLHAFMDEWGRRLLPEPLLADPPDVLVIIPHATLHDMPIHLIRCGPNDEPLGAIAGISYGSSTSLLMRCASRNRARQHDLAAWEFDEAGKRRPVGAPAINSLIGGGVDATGGKNAAFVSVAEDVAAMLNGETLILGNDDLAPFSRAAVKTSFWRAEPPDVVVITAHGYVDPWDHRLSGLLVHQWRNMVPYITVQRTLGPFMFLDRPLRQLPPGVEVLAPSEVLTIEELALQMLDESPQLVAVAGCSAGWGRVLRGDEPASLVESFLHLGVPSVIGPLWDSEFESTKEWIVTFIRAWAVQGLPKALAARAANRHMLEAVPGRPERTGALTLRGDWL